MFDSGLMFDPITGEQTKTVRLCYKVRPGVVEYFTISSESLATLIEAIKSGQLDWVNGN